MHLGRAQFYPMVHRSILCLHVCPIHPLCVCACVCICAHTPVKPVSSRILGLLTLALEDSGTHLL